MRVIYENILKKYKKKDKYSQPNSMNMLTKKLKNIVTYQRNIQFSNRAVLLNSTSQLQKESFVHAQKRHVLILINSYRKLLHRD